MARYSKSLSNFSIKLCREKDHPREIFRYKFFTEDGLILEERQNIIFIELPKIRKIVESLLDKTRTIQSLTAIQKWCIFVKELNVK